MVEQGVSLEPLGLKRTSGGSVSGGNTPADVMRDLESKGVSGELTSPPGEVYFGRPGVDSKVNPNAIMDASGELNRVKNEYGQEKQDELVSRMGAMGASLRDDARSAEQQAGNYPYQFMNLAKDNPRGNLNGASFGQTLRFSRLADMLNNRLRYVPSPQVTLGTPETGFVGDGGATLEKYPQIETQEMRQMRANERMDEVARRAGIDLQSRIQAYPQDLQEQRDKAMLGLEGEILSTENDLNRMWQKMVLEMEYAGSVENYFKKMFQRFLTDEELNKNDRTARYLYSVAPTFAQLWANVAGIGGSVPNRMVRYINEMVDQIWNMPISTAEKAAMYTQLFQSFGLSASTIEWIIGTQLINTGAKNFISGLLPFGGGSNGGSSGGSSGGSASYYEGPEATRDRVRRDSGR